VITSQDVHNYLQAIPAAPTVVRQALNLVQEGDLVKAAKCANDDPALRHYLKILVNRPLYGFKNEVTDVAQIFGILGLSATQQTLYNYLLSLLVPKKWSLFTLTNGQFYDFQASLSKKWEMILTHLGIQDKELLSAVSLIPATIIVCDALFTSHKEEIAQLRSVKNLDFSTILQRLSGKNLFDLASEIGQLWRMPDTAITLIQNSSGLHHDISKEKKHLAQWMHLLLFYELSQSTYVSAGLNEFIDFQIDFVQDIYESFMTVVSPS
jgi:HD-like signal output (HDOD) protein